MMAWPYHFVDLTEAQKHHRRQLLDRYGLYSQLSALIPIALYQLYRLAGWVYSERQRTKISYAAVPSSPVAKKARTSPFGAVVRHWRRLVWWLEGEVAPRWGLGLRGQWIATGLWIVWLLFLCVNRTGDDYLHITKRFGEVAVAQLPLHYMLAMKSTHSPLALIFRASHEQLNPWHRLNAKAIYTLLLLHATWYLNFFVQANLIPKRLQDQEVYIGITAFFLLTILVSSSLEPVRRWSYRLFFLLHLSIGIAIPPLLFFHAAHLRLYVTEAMAFFVIDVLLRKLDTTTGYAKVTAVANTKLVKLAIQVPAPKLHRFNAAPGQHVYLSIPPRSRPAGKIYPMIHEFLYNPFTIASVSTSEIVLVVRSLNGPTSKALTALTKLPKAKPPISIEGPLGGSQHFPKLARKYDRVLLVAGGVGATFIHPIYKQLRQEMEAEAKSPDRLTFVWSMRSAAESSWVIDSEEDKTELDTDENIRIYVTRSNADDAVHEEELLPADGSVELDELTPAQEPVKINGGRGRPELGKIVAEVFKGGQEERIAVLVCGPKAMARELREHVGQWIGKGRDVWYHDEGFGW